MNSIPFNQFSNQDNPETNMPYQNNLTSSLPVLEPQGNESAQEMNANNLNSVPEEKIYQMKIQKKMMIQKRGI